MRLTGYWVVLKGKFRGWVRAYMRASYAAILDESGQDLVEYSLVVALIALAAVASMKNVAVLINAAYTRLGTKLSGYVS